MSTSESNPTPEPPAPRNPGKARAKQSVPISVFLGIMVVPLAAAASMFLVSPQIQEPAALASEPSVAETVAASVPDLAQDLLVACGPVAAEMIELDRAGGLTTLQAAALDALRPICAQEGLPLPAPEAQTVQAVVTRPNPVASSVPVGSDDDDWDDSLDSDDSSDDWDDSFDSDDSSDDWDD